MTSPDGKKTFPFRLQHGDAYPEPTALPGGGRVVPQESYTSTHGGRCEHALVFPELVGLPGADAAKKLNLALRARVLAEDPREDCAESMDVQASYQVRPLGKRLLAIDIGHYQQFGDIRGHGWDDCAVADLAAGTLAPTQTLFAPGGLEKLSDLLRVALLAATPDAGPERDNLNELYWQIGPDTPICLEAKGARIAINGHPLYGPWQQTIPYAQVVPLLVPGDAADALK